jgi:hypothetical protein
MRVLVVNGGEGAESTFTVRSHGGIAALRK